MDRKKEINVFIGSSTVEFGDERKELVCFIAGLNNDYRLNKGVNIEAHICENTSKEMRVDGSQKQHDDYIRDKADITVFMFGERVGKDTVQELELARKTFLENTNRPKVFVFFKYLEKTSVPNDEIAALKAQLKEWGYQYPKFNHLDTIKLELVLCIFDLLNEKDELDIKDGKIYWSNQVIDGLNILNVYAYQNNPNLRDMKKKIKELEKELSACPKGNDNEAFKISVELTKLREEYHKLEKNILDMFLFFTKERNKSGKIDPTLAQAYEYLEQGNVDAAKKLISQKTLNSLAESIKTQRELANEILKQNEETLISHTYAMIKILAVDVKNKKRFSKIEQAYENAYETAVNRCEYDFIYDYVSFLYDQITTIKQYA